MVKRNRNKGIRGQVTGLGSFEFFSSFDYKYYLVEEGLGPSPF